MERDEIGRSRDLIEKFESFIARSEYPCVGAKSAFGQDQARFFVGADLRDSRDDRLLLSSLYRFIEDYRREPLLFATFVAIFQGPTGLSEPGFERALWARLNSLHRLDGLRHDWDPRVSSDPESPMFSFSLMSEACFVIGLHDGASRAARRFERPALVFNLHAQFDRLREEGRYEGLRDSIRARDAAFDGEPNPMVAGFGEISEARQYSGRKVDDDWRCPFHKDIDEQAA